MEKSRIPDKTHVFFWHQKVPSGLHTWTKIHSNPDDCLYGLRPVLRDVFWHKDDALRLVVVIGALYRADLRREL